MAFVAAPTVMASELAPELAKPAAAVASRLGTKLAPEDIKANTACGSAATIMPPSFAALSCKV
jgi:hypothetical protein